MKQLFVSVVITIYNEEKVLAGAVDSMLNQTFKRFELILVNNGSTDRTRNALKAYEKDPRVRILSLAKNLGPGGGRNAGAKIARGEILIFVDADMVFAKDYLKDLIAPILAGKEIGTSHDTEIVKNKERLWARSFSINRIENPPATSGVYRAILKERFFAAGGFDTSKGYFDDGLVGIRPSRCVHATCYHKNPESLREILKHSMWVGRSLLQAPSQRPRALLLLAGSVIGLLALLAFALFSRWLVFFVAIGIGAFLFLAFLVKKTVPRLKDGYPEFILTVPIVWSVRLLGYYLGAWQQFLRERR